MTQLFIAVPSYEVWRTVDEQAATAQLDLTGLGPLAPYASAANITDLCINGEAGLWLDAARGLVRQDDWDCDESTLRELAVRLVALGGRAIDEASPCVDMRLAHGIRVQAVLPSVSSAGTLLSIRLPRAKRLTLDALATRGLFGTGDAVPPRVERLRGAVRARENLLITGRPAAVDLTASSASTV